AGLSASRLAPFTGCTSAPPALTRSSGTAADLPPSIASTTPATFPDSPGPVSSRRERRSAKVALPQHVPMLVRQPASRGDHQMAVHDMLAGVADWLLREAAVRMLRVHGPTPLGTRPC